MIQFLFAMQIISIVVLLAEVVYMVSRVTSRGQALVFLFVLEAFVNNVGYLLELVATTKETAIMGTKICYLGKTFLLLTVFMYIMHFCKIKVSRILFGGLVAFHTLILFLVFFAEKTNLYYSNISYTEEGFFSHLILEHGIVYKMYEASMILYFTVMFFVLVRRYLTIRNKVEKRQIICLLSMLIVNGICVALFLMHLTGGYDTTAMGYFIAALILLFAIFRYNMFDTLEMAKEFVVDNMDSGVIVLDDDDNLLYCNAVALEIYPKLNKKTPNIIEEVKGYYKREENIFSNERVYQVTREDIDNKDRRRGQLYVITDITDRYNYTEKLKHDVEEKTKEITRMQHSIIASFANMVEARDGLTGQHIRNTSLYVAIVARALKQVNSYEQVVSDEYVETMIEAAPLHDIGKIAISDTILCKPARLTEEEYDIMKTHSAIGAKMIDEALEGVGENAYMAMARDMAHYHHEKWDGTGYPNGLKGKEIPLCARIMAIADVYDALRSKRCYKEGFSKEKSLEIIKESSGTHFDPEIVEIFVQNIEAIEQV